MTLAYAARPIWSEGMLMCPQHMQQQDLYHEQFVEARLQALHAAPWGVVTIQLDTAALRAGTLQLLTFRGVLPDGTPLSLDATSPSRPPARPIGPHFPARTESLLVHLALPLLREGVPNYALTGEPLTTQRYRGMPQRVHDLVHARKDPRDLQVSEPSPAFLFDNEPRSDFATLPVAELVRDETGGFRLSETFIPPALMLAAAPPIAADLHDVLSRAVTRRRHLAEERRARDGAKFDFTQRELDKTFFLHALDTAIPWLRHCSDTTSTPPLVVYRALASLAGGLMTVAAEGDPTELPPFHHTDLRATFAPLFVELRRLLSKEFDPVSIELPLRIHQGTSWVGEFLDERLLHCPTFVLVVTLDGDLVVANREIPEIAKVASWSRIGKIVENNALGVPLQATVRPPPEIPVQPHQAYFILNLNDPNWHELVRDRRIAVFLRPPYDPQRAKVRLFGIPRKKDG
ncbi:MAG TPA: type VI secretion system baseplate subunit TssK [Nannocystaceae bacterium]|nr:type VI secretion system baseplate subunit TssK [Nannocystaceae bacterium]